MLSCRLSSFLFRTCWNEDLLLGVYCSPSVIISKFKMVVNVHFLGLKVIYIHGGKYHQMKLFSIPFIYHYHIYCFSNTELLKHIFLLIQNKNILFSLFGSVQFISSSSSLTISSSFPKLDKLHRVVSPICVHAQEDEIIRDHPSNLRASHTNISRSNCAANKTFSKWNFGLLRYLLNVAYLKWSVRTVKLPFWDLTKGMPCEQVDCVQVQRVPHRTGGSYKN